MAGLQVARNTAKCISFVCFNSLDAHSANDAGVATRPQQKQTDNQHAHRRGLMAEIMTRETDADITSTLISMKPAAAASP